MSRGIKVGNDYADRLEEIYDKVPKAVLAAIAVSSLTVGGDYLEEAKARLVYEWDILYKNGIVSQKPPKDAIRADGSSASSAPSSPPS